MEITVYDSCLSLISLQASYSLLRMLREDSYQHTSFTHARAGFCTYCHYHLNVNQMPHIFQLHLKWSCSGKEHSSSQFWAAGKCYQKIVTAQLKHLIYFHNSICQSTAGTECPLVQNMPSAECPWVQNIPVWKHPCSQTGNAILLLLKLCYLCSWKYWKNTKNWTESYWDLKLTWTSYKIWLQLYVIIYF